jgi:hypothetical protein
MKLW